MTGTFWKQSLYFDWLTTLNHGKNNTNSNINNSNINNDSDNDGDNNSRTAEDWTAFCAQYLKQSLRENPFENQQ